MFKQMVSSLILFQSSRRLSSKFVPKHDTVTHDDVQRLQSFLNPSKQLFVLTGAGASTESGLPDYRSADVGLYAKSGHKPMEIQMFMSSEAARRRYWARNYIVFPRLCKLQPNSCHKAIAEWEKKGRVSVVVTQNVDRLHHKAGSAKVIELHGNGYIVKCTNKIYNDEDGCKYEISRNLFQKQLDQLNPDVFNNLDEISGQIRPDMDIDVDSNLVKNFQVPSCPVCNGTLKPDIIFFGDNVPKSRVDTIYKHIETSDTLLVVGSSLFVYSGYRFVLFANEAGKRIAIVNIGLTRASHFNHILHINKRCGEILPQIKL